MWSSIHLIQGYQSIKEVEHETNYIRTLYDQVTSVTTLCPNIVQCEDLYIPKPDMPEGTVARAQIYNEI